MITQTKPQTPPADRPTTKKLIIIRGRGTPNEQHIVTDVTLYWCNSAGRWVTIPADNRGEEQR